MNYCITEIGDLSQGRDQLAAASSSSFGYFAGGEPGPTSGHSRSY